MEGYTKFVTLATILTVLMFAALGTAIFIQKANATIFPCSNCAKDFALGDLAKSPGDAKNFAPGQEAKIPIPPCSGCAEDFAPGQLKKGPK